jgi:hypothetical protein
MKIVRFSCFMGLLKTRSFTLKHYSIETLKHYIINTLKHYIINTLNH